MTELISSTKNPRIKELLSLMEKSRARKEAGLFPVEGVREIGHAIEAGIVPAAYFLCKDILAVLPDKCWPSDSICDISSPWEEFPGSPRSLLSGCRIFEVTPEVYSHIAYREGTEGVVAVFHTPAPLKLEDLNVSPSGAISSHPALLMVAESVEKPGNIGALLRTADAAGIDAVILCDPLTDLYNPNVIRASIGGVFTNRIVCCASSEAINFFRSHSIRILTAQLQDSVPYYDSDMTLPTAIVFGTESTGLTQPWREVSSGRIRIPMLGRIDSPNVSVSAAVLCFEALRQRQESEKYFTH